MSTSNSSEYGFEFQDAGVTEESETEFDEQSEFEGNIDDFTDKSEVFIFTDTFQIRGKISLVPGARLTDYIVSASLFIAVAEVEVCDKNGALMFTTPFLNVHRDHIELILPAELAKFSKHDV